MGLILGGIKSVFFLSREKYFIYIYIYIAVSLFFPLTIYYVTILVNKIVNIQLMNKRKPVCYINVWEKWICNIYLIQRVFLTNQNADLPWNFRKLSKELEMTYDCQYTSSSQLVKYQCILSSNHSCVLGKCSLKS